MARAAWMQLFRALEKTEALTGQIDLSRRREDRSTRGELGGTGLPACSAIFTLCLH
jgi:hypothetical protein